MKKSSIVQTTISENTFKVNRFRDGWFPGGDDQDIRGKIEGEDQFFLKREIQFFRAGVVFAFFLSASHKRRIGYLGLLLLRR